MTSKLFKTHKILIYTLLFTAYFFILCLFMHEKSNLHMDEVSSYCGANNSLNNSISIDPVFVFKYEDAAEPWISQMTVQRGHEFDYKNVASLIKYDNHPPLYFMMLHTVSSFFPGRFSKWFAGGINIFFCLLTLCCVIKIAYILTKNDLCTFIVSSLFCLSSGVLSAATYLRMYLPGMFFVTFMTLILLYGLTHENWLFYITAFCCAFLGVMTHYYIAVYYFAVSIVYTVYMAVTRNCKRTLLYVLDMIAAAIAFMFANPSFFNNLFYGYDRNDEVINNLTSTFAEKMIKIRHCASIVDTQLFGGLFKYILIIIVLMTIVAICIRKKKQKTIEHNNTGIIVFLIPLISTVFYMILVSIMTVYETPRYFYPIYAVLMVSVVALFFNIACKIDSKIFAYIVTCIVFLTCTAYKFKDNIHYLYRSTRPLIAFSQNMQDTDCIFLVQISFDVNSSFYEVSNYNSVTFIKSYSLIDLEYADINTENGLVVKYTPDLDPAEVDSAIRTRWPELQPGIEIGYHTGIGTMLFTK